MELFWMLIDIIAVIAIVAFTVAAAATWICNILYPCQHAYERVDTCNDKKMILVCQKCGKIKKLSK